jgi:hypothetical protein
MIIFMPGKKAKIDKAAERIADLLIEHMEATMTPAQGRCVGTFTGWR